MIILHECDTEFQVQCPLHLGFYFLAWRWGSATSLCCSSPSILVAGTKAELSVGVKKRVEPESGSPMFSLLRSAYNWVISVLVSYCDLCVARPTDPSFLGEPKRKSFFFSVNASHPPSTAKQVLPLGSCQISGVGLEPLASQEKVVKLPDEWNRPISWVSDTKQRQRNVCIFPFPLPALARLLAQPEMPSPWV